MDYIHPTAIVSENADIAESVKIGAYAIIEDGVAIGANSVVEPHARICSGAVIGENCTIGSFTTIAGLPQDISFDKTLKTGVKIGNNTTVREGATIHRATREDSPTTIGENCFLMANAHIGHDGQLGNRVIVAPFTATGGHVQIGDDAFISGGVMLHQRLRVGCGVMVSGNATVSLDIPPFVTFFERNNIAGLNLVGMLRRKVSREAIANVKSLYHVVYTSGGNPRKNAEKALAEGMVTTPEGEIFIKFFTEAAENRHFVRPLSKNAQQ